MLVLVSVGWLLPSIRKLYSEGTLKIYYTDGKLSTGHRWAVVNSLLLNKRKKFEIKEKRIYRRCRYKIFFRNKI